MLEYASKCVGIWRHVKFRSLFLCSAHNREVLRVLHMATDITATIDVLVFMYRSGPLTHCSGSEQVCTREKQ